jgi:WD40 repeat protein
VRFRHARPVLFVACSPDGKLWLSSTGDGTFRLWERATGRPLHSLQGQLQGPFSAGLSADGKTVALVGLDLRIHLWDAHTGKEVRALGRPQTRYNRAAFSPDGKTAAVVTPDQALHLWDLAGDHEIRLLAAPSPDGSPTFHYAALAFSPDGRLFAAGGVPLRGGAPALSIRLWEVPSGKERPPLAGPVTGITSLAFAPDGKRLAVGGTQAVHVFDLAAGKELSRVNTPRFGGSWVAFAPDGKRLALGDGSEVKVADPATGKLLRRLPAGPFRPVCLAFSGDGKLLAVGGGDHTIRLWDVSTGQEVEAPAGHRATVAAVAISPDGKAVATSGVDGTVRLWDAATGWELHRFARPQGEEKEEPAAALPAAVAFPRGGRALAAAWPLGPVRLWDAASGKELRREHIGPGSSQVLAFSPAGDILAEARQDGTIRLSDVGTGRPLGLLVRPKDAAVPLNMLVPTAVALSADGKTVAAGEAELRPVLPGMAAAGPPPPAVSAVVRLWEAATGRTRARLHPGASPASLHGPLAAPGVFLGGTGLPNPVTRLAFSPDGRQLAVVTRAAVHIWDLGRGREVHRLTPDPLFGTLAVAFSPDGKLLALGGQGSLSLWDARTGEERCCVGSRPAPDAGLAYLFEAARGRDAEFTCLAFSADGKALLSGSTDTTAIVWDVGRLLEEGRRSRTDLSAAQLQGLWNELGGDDAERAYRALWALVDAPRRAVPFVGERLRPVPAVDVRRLALLVADLGSKHFAARQRAAQELEKLEDVAEPILRKLLEQSPPLDVRRRAEQLLDRLSGPVRTPEPLRGLRAVEVLERIGTPEARAVLHRLAGGAPEARLTREARAALERLAPRREVPPG